MKKKKSRATKVVVSLHKGPLHPKRILNISICEKQQFKTQDPGEKTLDQG